MFLLENLSDIASFNVSQKEKVHVFFT